MKASKPAKSKTAKRMTDMQSRDSQIGIESIETGMQLLAAFVKLGGRTHQLKVLASAASMPPSKAHRYLVSLIRMGFVDRDAVTGHYRLGPQCIELGAAALGAMDAFSLSIEAMVELHDELDHTMVLSVWGTSSPVIIRVEESDRLITVSFRVGRSLPLLASASGQLFSAFLPRLTVEPLLQAEIRNNRERAGGRSIRSMAEAERLLSEVRSRGLARIAGDITPGINAIGAPVFDYRGYPATTISAIGPANSFDNHWNGTVAEALRRKTNELSRKLGYKPSSANRQQVTKDPS
jgi:DNA-binding IclR family transcriptional regulator